MATYIPVSSSDADAYASSLGWNVNRISGSGTQYLWKVNSIPNFAKGNQVLKGKIDSNNGNVNVFAMGDRITIGDKSSDVFALGSDFTIYGGQVNNFVVNYASQGSGSYVKNVNNVVVLNPIEPVRGPQYANQTIVGDQYVQGRIDFSTNPLVPVTSSVGRLYWDDTDGTLNLGLKGGNVTLPIGETLVARILNNTGTYFSGSNYQVVKVTGASNNRLTVDLAQADATANYSNTLGIVAENISGSTEGFVVISGLIEGLDTTGTLQGESWSSGDVLYLSAATAGAITNTAPTSPDFEFKVGYIVSASATGSIYVNIDGGIASGGGTGIVTGSYGSFYSTSSQTLPSSNFIQSMSYNVTDFSNGVYISGSDQTQIKIENDGLYNIQFSAQFDRSTGGTANNAYIWFRKNGTDIPDSNTEVHIPQGSDNRTVAAWNYWVSASAGDYYQIMWSATDVHTRLLYNNTPTTGPAVPSVILTVNSVLSGTITGGGGDFVPSAWTGSAASQFAGTASYATTASYALNATPPFPYTGSAEITGSLIVSGGFIVHDVATGFNTIQSSNTLLIDTTGVTGVDWSGRTLSDGAGTQVLNWGSAGLYDVSGLQSMDWSARTLFDSAGNTVGDWETQRLWDNSGNRSLDWINRILYDGGAVPAFDWQNRQLYANDGSTIHIDWTDPNYMQLLNVQDNAIDKVLGIDGSGRVYVTASSAIGGGGGGDFVPSAWTGSSTSQFSGTASLANTASYFKGPGGATIRDDSNNLYIDANRVYISGSNTIEIRTGGGATDIYGNLNLKSLVNNPSPAHTNVLTIDPGSGLIAYTASSAIGGGGSATPGGSNTQVQFNNGGAFAGDSSFTFNNTSKTLTITGSLTVSGSSTFTNIGPAIFSGSVTSTQGFTGSFSGIATTASYVANALVTASTSANVITFTKGDGSQFSTSVNSGGTNIAAKYMGFGNNLTGSSLAISSSYNLLIPANTFTVGDTVRLQCMYNRDIRSSAASFIWYITGSTTPFSFSVAGATQLAIYNVIANSGGGVAMSRLLYISSSTNTELVPTTGGTLFSDEHQALGNVSWGGTTSSLNIDWTQDQWIVFAYQQNAPATAAITRAYRCMATKV